LYREKNLNTTENNPYNMVLIRGRVIEQFKEGAVEHTDRLAKKYLGVDKHPFPTPIEKRYYK
jgi:hypothetical protein